MILENDACRLKVIDGDNDTFFVHEPEPNGSVVLSCYDAERDEYAACLLTDVERKALIARLQGHGSRCPECLGHPGWATPEESKRSEPADVCRACLGSGTSGVEVGATYTRTDFDPHDGFPYPK